MRREKTCISTISGGWWVASYISIWAVDHSNNCRMCNKVAAWRLVIDSNIPRLDAGWRFRTKATLSGPPKMISKAVIKIFGARFFFPARISSALRETNEWCVSACVQALRNEVGTVPSVRRVTTMISSKIGPLGAREVRIFTIVVGTVPPFSCVCQRLWRGVLAKSDREQSDEKKHFSFVVRRFCHAASQ